MPFLSARIKPSPALPTTVIEYSSVIVAESNPFSGVGNEKRSVLSLLFPLFHHNPVALVPPTTATRATPTSVSFCQFLIIFSSLYSHHKSTLFFYSSTMKNICTQNVLHLRYKTLFLKITIKKALHNNCVMLYVYYFC
ncbi:hypothetical protein L963_1412 [Leuconostoc mesenteroides subsp. cremoris T26]|nr:hypothetical protein L963_1412 [Leuconostoc mesenteroides subsp. cremoris T26]